MDLWGKETGRYGPLWQFRSQVKNTHTEEVGRNRTSIPADLPQHDCFQGQQKTWETDCHRGMGGNSSSRPRELSVHRHSICTDGYHVQSSLRRNPFVYLCTQMYVCQWIKLKSICQVSIKQCWGSRPLILPNLYKSVLHDYFLNIFSLIIWQLCTCMKSILVTYACIVR